MKNKIIVGVLAVLLIIGGAWYFNTNRQDEKVLETTKVKIAYLPIVQGLPLYLAIEKGYFKDAGIDVEAVKFDAPNQIVDALLSQQIDFAIDAATGISGIAEIKKADSLRVFMLTGGDNVVSNDSILVKTDSKIGSIQDLKTKKLGILPGIQWRTIATDILAKNNLVADKDVILVELAAGLQAQALGSSQIDALLGVEPTPTVIKTKSIGKEIVKNPTVKYIADPFYGGAGVVTVNFAKQNPNTTAKVLAIFYKAIKEINTNSNETRQYLKGYTALTDELISKVPVSLFKMYRDFNQKDLDATQKFLDIFKTYNIVDRNINIQGLIYSPIK